MKSTATLTLTPLRVHIEAPIGTPLHSLLFSHGIEFPCGGKGACRGCRVRVLEGSLPVTLAQESILSKEELDNGWRLACQSTLESDLLLDVAQWETPCLSDESAFDFSPRDGFGVAVDVGTTTIVAQLLDLHAGTVLAVQSGLNQQAIHGADIMTRIDAAVNRGRAEELTTIIRWQIGAMIRALVQSAGADPGRISDVVLVGNSVMHHLFGDLECAPLSRYPFAPLHLEALEFVPPDLSWTFADHTRVRFLPLLGGFVGSDILAGILATDMHECQSPVCLIDLGTNGEVVIGTQRELVCCSTAAGPAFEGARISMGMRAATGAIAGVTYDGSKLHYDVIGEGEPRGICGSGLVDAAAVLLDRGDITPSGLFAEKAATISLVGDVVLTQADVRELQLAKGAISAGVRILCEEAGIMPDALGTVYLGGAFGNYVNRLSARRIGLIDFPPARVVPSGNTALRGAKRALFADPQLFDTIAHRVRHISLHAHPQFMEYYVQAMTFPDRSQCAVFDNAAQ